MFIINCPYCGERDQTEFTCHGEAHIARPEKPSEVTDEEWGKYLFFRNNADYWKLIFRVLKCSLL